MPSIQLWLVELHNFNNSNLTTDELVKLSTSSAKSSNIQVEETVISSNQDRIYLVLSHDQPEDILRLSKSLPSDFDGPHKVRFIGTPNNQEVANPDYLVEWKLPSELTMEQYLKRKKEKGPRYARVPEVTFLRTYVREDMNKCLCLYGATCEEDVVKARAAVETPFDSIVEIQPNT